MPSSKSKNPKECHSTQHTLNISLCTGEAGDGNYILTNNLRPAY
jgi:hypothetical protein